MDKRFKIPDVVTNSRNNNILKDEVKKFVKENDVVSVIFRDKDIRNIRVIKVLDDDTLLGYICDIDSLCFTCDVCTSDLFYRYIHEINPCYSCKGKLNNKCDFHCHEKCLHLVDHSVKKCNCELMETKDQAGELIEFDRKYIRKVCISPLRYYLHEEEEYIPMPREFETDEYNYEFNGGTAYLSSEYYENENNDSESENDDPDSENDDSESENDESESENNEIVSKHFEGIVGYYSSFFLNEIN